MRPAQLAEALDGAQRQAAVGGAAVQTHQAAVDGRRRRSRSRPVRKPERLAAADGVWDTIGGDLPRVVGSPGCAAAVLAGCGQVAGSLELTRLWVSALA